MLNDITLQLGLPVDGSVVTRVVRIGDWSAIRHQLLGKVPDKFSGSRIEMKWLEDNLSHLNISSSAVER
ncbi:hypothetical protein Godav_028809 [Gossypium davidsonii]|uniref:Uncharacterized protein n=1 Tax=Gossypium davidsonii TaxID=34287 RepID=A0A7J8THM4_GOSDV|nr:hypothetical protein [Gossypium davidsonii]